MPEGYDRYHRQFNSLSFPICLYSLSTFKYGPSSSLWTRRGVGTGQSLPVFQVKKLNSPGPKLPYLLSGRDQSRAQCFDSVCFLSSGLGDLMTELERQSGNIDRTVLYSFKNVISQNSKIGVLIVVIKATISLSTEIF